MDRFDYTLSNTIFDIELLTFKVYQKNKSPFKYSLNYNRVK